MSQRPIRDLTTSYVQSRQNQRDKRETLKSALKLVDSKRNRKGYLQQDEDNERGNSLLVGRRQNPHFDVEMSKLPPQWMEMADEASEEIRKLRECVAQLLVFQQKRLQRVFQSVDKTSEHEISQLSLMIGELIKTCNHKILIYMDEEVETNDLRLRMNVQRKHVIDLDTLSSQFQKASSAYVEHFTHQHESLIGFDSESRDLDYTSSLQQVHDAQELRGNDLRSQDLARITSTIRDVNLIFKDINETVIQQGTAIDRIDYNLEKVVDTASLGKKELIKAEITSRSGRAKRCQQGLLLFISAHLLLYLLRFIAHVWHNT